MPDTESRTSDGSLPNGDPTTSSVPTAEVKKQLKKLRQQRTVRRNKLREILAEAKESTLGSPDARDDSQTRTTLAIVSQHLAKIQEFNDKVVELLDDGAEVFEREVAESEAFDIEVDEAVALMTTATVVEEDGPADATIYATPEGVRHVRFRPPFESTLNVGSRAPRTPGVSGSPVVNPTPTAAATGLTRLPRELDISPEVFSGDRLKYRAFMTQFRCFVEKRPESQPIERLMTLRKFVSGEPKEIVHSLELTDANYEVALSLLDENYGRVENETERILSELRNLPRITRHQDLPALRKLVTSVQSRIATLAANGIPLAAFAPSLKSALEAALPARMRQEFKDARRMERRFFVERSGESDTETTVPQNLAGLNINSRATADIRDPVSFVDKAVVEVQKIIEFLRVRIRDWEDNKHFDDVNRPGDTRDNGDQRSQTRNSNHRARSTMSAVSSNSNARAPPRARTSADPRFKPRPCLFCKATDHSTSRCSAGIPLEKRKEILASQRRCERCFRDAHASPGDCRGPRSSCTICRSPQHYTSMHPGENLTSSAVVAGSTGVPVNTNTLLWTACAYVVNGGMRIPIRLFLDNGSTLTVISPALRAMLREPPVAINDLTIQAFASVHKREAVPVYSVRLQGPKGGKVLEFFAHEYDFGVDPTNNCLEHIVEEIKKFDQSRPLADRSYVGEWNPSAPSMLVGMNQLHKIMIRAAPELIVDQIEAQPSHFGWVIGGSAEPRDRRIDGTITAAHVVCCSAALSACSARLSSPAEALQTLWSLDTLGIAETPAASALSADDESAIQQFESSVAYDGRRYTVAFPKRPSISRLPNNKRVARNRLERKIAQLKQDPEQYQRYHEEVMKFVNEGYAREVIHISPDGPSEVDGSYFMPHHQVITGSGVSLKWRIVFDCSSKEKGSKSLNECLLTGPNLNPDLVTVLLNFRLHPVAVAADIERAYMRIAISESDQSLFRFLWRPPGSSSDKIFQMQRVTWGAASSGFLLAATVRHHLKNSDSASQSLSECLYADDFLQSFEDDAGATDFTDRIRATLGTAGMSLAKWKTNSESVGRHLINTGVEPGFFDSGSGGLLKVLGIAWSPTEDVFRFTVPPLMNQVNLGTALSKRKVLSIVASLYDPMGWLIPFTLRGKKFIQRLWAADLQWNQQVPSDVHRDLVEWITELTAFERLQIPRHYARSHRTLVGRRLHVFGDASKTAYACAAYLENRYADNPSTFTLVMSKSRLAPRDSPSLPRLELLACLIAVRLKNFLVDRMSVRFEKTFFYTDSTIAYHWVTSCNPGGWKAYVNRRVLEIQAASDAEDWFHVGGNFNISDLATRGIHAESLTNCPGWWFGPEWLSWPQAQQPISRPKTGDDTLASVRDELRGIMSSVIVAQPLIELDRYSSASRAVRVLCRTIKFCCLARRQEVPLPAALYRKAENELIRWCQQQHFRTEISNVIANERVSPTSKLAAFNLFLDDDGLLRARTRLTVGPIFTYDEKNPIVVPGESRLASLLIADAHRVNAHFGVSTVLTQLRRRFWITRARQIITALLRRCVICRKRHGVPAAQIEAPLPEFRTELQVPFGVTGVDFCGPFYTRIRKETVKTYCALFSCCATRAIHLEAVPSQSTPQTHLAIRRFLATYPGCVRFVSDNGRSFVKAATEIKRLFHSVKSPEVSELLEGRTVDWIFIPPRASWHGGVYERMVGVLKAALHKTLGRSLVGYEEFRTCLCELAAVINDRPITQVSTDDDAPAALTPAQFLRGGPLRSALASVLPLDRLRGEELASGEELQRELKRRSSYFRDLSVRWFREYMLLLRSANTTKGGPSPPIRVGDVCILREDNEPRIRWKLVRIMEAHQGRDGRVRVYTVKFPNSRTSRRAVQLLYPLEVGAPRDSTQAESSANQPDSEK